MAKLIRFPFVYTLLSAMQCSVFDNDHYCITTLLLDLVPAAEKDAKQSLSTVYPPVQPTMRTTLYRLLATRLIHLVHASTAVPR